MYVALIVLVVIVVAQPVFFGGSRMSSCEVSREASGHGQLDPAGFYYL